MSQSELQKTTAATEDCILHITYTGTGSKLLVLIPGGRGLGGRFHAALPGLANPASSNSEQHTVAVFDRRGHGASNLTPSGNVIARQWNPAQSARDVLAIIKHLGFERASVFGTSGGGIIAFQFAVMFPQHVDKLIVHESPTMALLPADESVKMIDFCFDVYQIYKTQGADKAMRRFLTMGEGWNARGDSDKSDEASAVGHVDVMTDREDLWWFEHEYISMTIYTPNLFALKAFLSNEFARTMSCAVVVGKASGQAPYARTTYVQKDLLGCQHHVWPGGHSVYAADPEAFVTAMLETLRKLDGN